jgi:hypothetical protein
MKRAILTGALIAGAVVAVPAAGAQAATQCTTVLTNRTISGPLEVPSGAGCVLRGVQVNGNVVIDPGGALSFGAQGNSRTNTVTGNVTGSRIQSFDSFFPLSTIDGSLNLTGVSGLPEGGPLNTLNGNDDTDNYLDDLAVHGATSITGSATAAPWQVEFASLGGAFTYTGNAGDLELTETTIVGAATIAHNTGGGSIGNRTTIGGSLNCGNTPLFGVLAGVSVSGHNGSTGGAC